MKDPWQEKFFELGRTETIQDSLAPEWVKKFIMDYNFEIVQRIRFEVCIIYHELFFFVNGKF